MRSILLVVAIALVGCARTKTEVVERREPCSDLATYLCQRDDECHTPLAGDPEQQCTQHYLEGFAKNGINPGGCSAMLPSIHLLNCEAFARGQATCSTSQDCVPGAYCDAQGHCSSKD